MSDGPAGLYPITDPRHPDYVPPATTPTPAPTPTPTPTPTPAPTPSPSPSPAPAPSPEPEPEPEPEYKAPDLVGEVPYAQTAVSGMPTLGDPVAIPSPAQRTVDPQELVEFRMSQMMKQDSPYTQQAMTNAMQFANQAGLLNTSIAASAGLDAAIRSALPIAQQDATTLHGQALENQRAVNEFLLQDYLTRNQFRLTEFGAQATTYNQGLEQAHRKNERAIQNAWGAHQNALQRQLDENLAEMKIAAEQAMQAAGHGHSAGMAASACAQNAIARLNARVMEIEANAHEMTSERYEALLKQARQAYDAEVAAC